MNSLNKALFEAYLTKAPNWWYEDEWRYLHDTPSVEYEVPGELKEIIFGWKTPEHLIEIVKKVSLFDDVKYFRMRFVDGSFEMERYEDDS